MGYRAGVVLIQRRIFDVPVGTAVMIGKRERDCKSDETVCPTCSGSTVGDFGQPFECETCQGSGVLPVFEPRR